MRRISSLFAARSNAQIRCECHPPSKTSKNSLVLDQRYTNVHANVFCMTYTKVCMCADALALSIIHSHTPACMHTCTCLLTQHTHTRACTQALTYGTRRQAYNHIRTCTRATFRLDLSITSKFAACTTAVNCFLENIKQ